MAFDLQSIKEEVRTRSDIVDIVGGYLKLDRAGKNFKGLCPFHSDRKPSFNVSPSIQIYKCYACGETGDVFTFIQKMESLDFIQALEFLARRAGIPFERREINPEALSEREEMRLVNRIAHEFFREQLSKSEDACQYLAGRGVLKTTQDEWEIGYAPAEWDALLKRLQKSGADLELAAKLGLLKERREGSGYYDAYRNRIIFPIHDISGQLVGFGGRALSPDDPAKYINSDGSAIFDKSATLYGLVSAKKRFSNGDTPVFVEGYLDVVATHQAGFTQCVATLGTALTEQHVRILSRYTNKVILCYDQDAAGMKAAIRGAALWEELGPTGSEALVVRLPQGEDPDSLLRKGDSTAFQRALDAALPRVDYLLQRIRDTHDITTESGKDAALNEAVAVVATVPRLSVRARYVEKIADLHPLHGRYGFERAVEQILSDAAQVARTLKTTRPARAQGYPLSEAQNGRDLQYQPNPASTEQKTEHVHTLSGAEKAERQLLRALLGSKWRVWLLNKLTADQMCTPEGAVILQWVARTPSQIDGNIDSVALLHLAEDDRFPEDLVSDMDQQQREKITHLLQELLEESPFYVSNDQLSETAVQDCLIKLGRQKAELEKRRLHDLLSKSTSEEEQRSILEQYQRQMRTLRGTGS